MVNPDRRQQEGQRNSIQSKLNYRLSRFAAMELHPVIKKDETEDVKYKKWERKRAELLEEIEHYENELKTIKEKLREMERNNHPEQPGEMVKNHFSNDGIRSTN